MNYTYWGGGVQPHFCEWENCVFSHFSPWEKSIWKEREMNTFPSFSIYSFPIFPHGEKWGKWEKAHFSHGQKWGWTLPPHII